MSTNEADKAPRIFTVDDVKYLYEHKTKLFAPNKGILMVLATADAVIGQQGPVVEFHYADMPIGWLTTPESGPHKALLSDLRTVAGEVYPGDDTDTADKEPHMRENDKVTEVLAESDCITEWRCEKGFWHKLYVDWAKRTVTVRTTVGVPAMKGKL